jgi:hypothetical protein
MSTLALLHFVCPPLLGLSSWSSVPPEVIICHTYFSYCNWNHIVICM